MVQVTHRIDTIVPEMKRVLFLQQGRIIGDGSPAEMLTAERLSELFSTPLTVVEAGDSVRCCRLGLLPALGEIAEIIIIRLQELPDHRNGEHHHQPDGCPDGHSVVAVHALKISVGT